MLTIVHANGDVLNPETYLTEDHLGLRVNVIHGCNAQGVMGSGLALQVKNKHKGAFLKYKIHFDMVEHKRDMLGNYSFHKCNDAMTIINAVTQFNYGSDKSVRYTSYDAVDDCFKRITRTLEGYPDKITVLAIPYLFASDRGNADWDVVMAIIKSRLSQENVGNVVLYVVKYDGG